MLIWLLVAPIGAWAADEPPTIAILGDSLVQGYGLPPEEGFVPQMERWLSENGIKAVLINAGVSGDTTAGGLSRIDWTLTPEVDALVVSLGGNDVLRGIDPSIARENLRAILQRAADKGLPVLLVGIIAPGNYGPTYKQDFESIYPELAQEFGTALYPNFLHALVVRPDRADTLQRFYQPDGLHPNAAGVRLIVEDIGPHLSELVARAGSHN